jgi:hypothetical protein
MATAPQGQIRESLRSIGLAGNIECFGWTVAATEENASASAMRSTNGKRFAFAICYLLFADLSAAYRNQPLV